MIGLIQRVKYANVIVDQKEVGAIQQGILALIGIQKEDNIESGDKLIKKILSYRIFDDQDGKMNLSLNDTQGGLLLVPQFTLVADTKKGTRPGFSKGMPPNEGAALFNKLIEHSKKIYPHISSGVFGANMQVTLCNDGPVTFHLEV